MIIMNTNVKVAASVNNSIMNNNYKEFDLSKVMQRGAKVVTRDGHKARVVCQTRGKLLVTVFGNLPHENRQYKYNMNGSLYNNLVHKLDLMLDE